jgi:hypothetical protein
MMLHQKLGFATLQGMFWNQGCWIQEPSHDALVRREGGNNPTAQVVPPMLIIIPVSFWDGAIVETDATLGSSSLQRLFDIIVPAGRSLEEELETMDGTSTFGPCQSQRAKETKGK